MARITVQFLAHLAIVVIFLMTLSPVGAQLLTQFTVDGQEMSAGSIAVFTERHGGAQVSSGLPIGSTVMDGAFNLGTDHDAPGYPQNLRVDIGMDGELEYQFNGTHYGDFGSQREWQSNTYRCRDLDAWMDPGRNDNGALNLWSEQSREPCWYPDIPADGGEEINSFLLPRGSTPVEQELNLAIHAGRHLPYPPHVYDSMGAGIAYSDVAFGDADNDGDEDMLVATPRWSYAVEPRYNPNLMLYLRNGDSFEDPIIFEGIDTPWGVAIGDVNNDGFNDIVVMATAGTDLCLYCTEVVVEIRLWNGAGWDEPIQKKTGEQGWGLTLAIVDGDGDGDNDIFFYQMWDRMVVLWRWDDADGPGPLEGDWTEAIHYLEGGTGSMHVILPGDLDGDGAEDEWTEYKITATGTGTGKQKNLDIYSWNETGAGWSMVHRETNASAGAGRVAGDFDSDGKPDLLWGSKNHTFYIEYNGEDWDERVELDIGYQEKHRFRNLVDSNNDGRDDIFIEEGILVQQPNGSFVFEYLGVGSSRLHVTDLEEDGMNEYIMARYGDGIFILSEDSRTVEVDIGNDGEVEWSGVVEPFAETVISMGDSIGSYLESHAGEIDEFGNEMVEVPIKVSSNGQIIAPLHLNYTYDYTVTVEGLASSYNRSIPQQGRWNLTDIPIEVKANDIFWKPGHFGPIYYDEGDVTLSNLAIDYHTDNFPDAVTNFTVLEHDDYVETSWDAHKLEEDGSYYWLHRREEGEEFNLSDPLANLTAMEYIDNETEEDKEYYYDVEFVTPGGLISNLTTKEVDPPTEEEDDPSPEEAPEPPTDLTAFLQAGNEVELSWDASPSEDVVDYRIYARQSDADYDMNIFNSTSETTFVGASQQADVTFHYVVRARADGESGGSSLSEPSNEVSVTFTGTIAPDHPTDVTMIYDPMSPGELEVTWSASISEDVVSYSVYIETEPLSDVGNHLPAAMLHGESRGFSLYGSDYDLEAGQTYFAAVTAHDEAGRFYANTTAESTAGPMLYQGNLELDMHYSYENGGELEISWVTPAVNHFQYFAFYVHTDEFQSLLDLNMVALVDDPQRTSLTLGVEDYPFTGGSSYYVGAVIIADNLTSSNSLVFLAGPEVWQPMESDTISGALVTNLQGWLQQPWLEGWQSQVMIGISSALLFWVILLGLRRPKNSGLEEEDQPEDGFAEDDTQWNDVAYSELGYDTNLGEPDEEDEAILDDDAKWFD